MKWINSLILTTLILSTLSGCAGNSGTTSDDPFGNLVARHTTFPASDLQDAKSSRYEDRIRSIAARSGNKAAMKQIILDFEKQGNKFQDGSFGNRLELYHLVCSLLSKIGKVDQRIHYFRNTLNLAPGSLLELMEQNAALSPPERWRLIPVNNSGYHMQGHNGIFNLKFVSANGFCEAVYNQEGELLTEANDPVNMGTFNYGAGISEKNAHQNYDVAPYLKWGNSESSPQRGKVEIAKSIRLVMKLYQANFNEVTEYRKKILEHKPGTS